MYIARKTHTPLRYPGGKTAFAPYISSLMQINGLAGGHYMELYAGGAGVALSLLYEGLVEHVHINDYDPAVSAFWIAATKHNDDLLELLNDTPITMKQWYKWRAILRGEKEGNVVEQGFATLFLSRTNRSGILKGGVTGGKEQQGQYKMDARFKKPVLSQKIIKIGKYANKISVHGKDALELLRDCDHLLPRNSLIYLDPPYYGKGQGLYRNYYNHADHLAIAHAIRNKNFKHRWIVTYDDVPQIREMYSTSPILNYDLQYTAQRRYAGREVMFFSEELTAPSETSIQ